MVKLFVRNKLLVLLVGIGYHLVMVRQAHHGMRQFIHDLPLRLVPLLAVLLLLSYQLGGHAADSKNTEEEVGVPDGFEPTDIEGQTVPPPTGDSTGGQPSPTTVDPTDEEDEGDEVGEEGGCSLGVLQN